MKRNFLIIITLFFPLLACAFNFHDEVLHYIVTYKWGIISKDSGEATISLKNNGAYFDIMLTGKTKPWADKFYQVRDTLWAKVAKEGFKPQYYKKSSHEKDRHSHDIVSYKYIENKVEGEALRQKRNKKGEIETTNQLFNATGNVFDMLSIVYYLRGRDYEKLKDGDVFKATMFSGSKMEELNLEYLGKEKIELKNKTKVDAYHIKFKFSVPGKKKSSDDIDTWLSTDGQHIPLLIIGNLAIGEIRCYYIP